MYTHINNSEFIQRLDILMDYYSIHASALANRIDVGRSTISHILSGRNKPSLEVILNILNAFEEVTFEWLVQGKGSFPVLNNENPVNSAPVPNKNVAPDENIISSKSEDTSTACNESIVPSSTSTSTTEDLDIIEKMVKPSKKLKRILLFFEDGSFESYENGI